MLVEVRDGIYQTTFPFYFKICVFFLIFLKISPLSLFIFYNYYVP